MMDNRQFNVNGEGKAMFLATMKLAFEQSGHVQAKGYFIDPKFGMVFLWHNDACSSSATNLPAPFNAEDSTNFAWAWLQSEPDIECKDWDADDDHDGSNGLGWRVYCENWGHVAGNHYAIIAVKPAYLWFGK